MMDHEVVIGFMDESSPQTTANTQRLWSFGKPIIHKNTDKMKANAFGCYMLNGTSVIDFKENSKKEDVSEFLETIRQKNPGKKIVLILDNFTSHTANYTKQCARDCGIDLVYLPKYSPDLNPIEYIWKSIKRVISRSFIYDIDHMRELIRNSFLENASKLSFAKYWIERFLGGDNWYNNLGF
jgi:putative transposase